MIRWLLLVVLGIGVLAGLGAAVQLWLEARAVQRDLETRIAVPADTPPDLLHRWFDVTPVHVRYTAAWQKFTIAVPRHVFQTDPTIWARMHFEDWDRLPATERQVPLASMLARRGAAIHAGDCWPVMSPGDWDDVPQPIRAVALLGIIEYWTRFYAVGETFGHGIVDMVRTVQAVVMSESWFEHRSVLTNSDGTRDLGMAGASAYARGVISDWHERGLVDFTLTDEEYFNPWHAGRFVAFWFDLMLHEADGDVELAIRAYNRGIYQARRGRGDDYLDGVLRRRRQFMEGPSRSPTWTTVLAWREEPESRPRPRCVW